MTMTELNAQYAAIQAEKQIVKQRWTELRAADVSEEEYDRIYDELTAADEALSYRSMDISKAMSKLV